jgi:hypothetical protein
VKGRGQVPIYTHRLRLKVAVRVNVTLGFTRRAIHTQSKCSCTVRGRVRARAKAKCMVSVTVCVRVSVRGWDGARRRVECCTIYQLGVQTSRSPCYTSRVAVHCPLATSHSHAVLSLEPVANVFPSALNATLMIPDECPSRKDC